MRKLIWMFSLVGFICLTSCEDASNNRPTKVVKEETGKVPFENVVEFKYKGHDYIKFSEYSMLHESFNGGVVHSPDCEKCIEIFD